MYPTTQTFSGRGHRGGLRGRRFLTRERCIVVMCQWVSVGVAESDERGEGRSYSEETYPRLVPVSGF